MPPSSPFHAGEIAIQQQLGVAERMAQFGSRVVRDHMPDQHRAFYAQLPFVVAGTVDAQGDAWATLLEGRPGFASAPLPTRLRLSVQPPAADPAAAGWQVGAAVGLLGIELHTRRRNRINGILAMGAEAVFEVDVEHAFGNCPQYIQARGIGFAHEPGSHVGGLSSAGSDLDEATAAFIRASDTFFIASYVDHADGRRSVDASHRGGKPGFVRVLGNRLSIPDYAGNLHFNTLGNLLLNPRAGLVFVDFSSGDVLQVTGRAVLDFDADEVRFFQGAERLWHLDVERWVLRRGALALRGDAGDVSLNSALTGSWEQVEARLQAEHQREHWRPFRVVRIDDESSVIKSFWLEPADGGGLGLFQAGQHLPVRAPIGADGAWVERAYTLSVAPSDGAYRLSIRRQGLFSEHMHGVVQVGDVIEARAARGSFTVDALEARPLVLLSAGVGITPMLAMLRHVVYEGVRTRKIRPTYFIHGGRNEEERGFMAEVEHLAESARGAVRVVQVLDRPGAAAREGVDFHAKGRIDARLLKAVLPFDDHDFYLCGPGGFMQSLYDQLRDLRIPDDRIHAEAFGPSSLRRRIDTQAESTLAPAASQSVAVVFADSAKEARWSPGGRSLLELAESRGLSPPYSCRSGSCGSCATHIVEGAVTYASKPGATHAPDQALVCCALPAQGLDRLVLAL